MLRTLSLVIIWLGRDGTRNAWSIQYHHFLTLQSPSLLQFSTLVIPLHVFAAPTGMLTNTLSYSTLNASCKKKGTEGYYRITIFSIIIYFFPFYLHLTHHFPVSLFLACSFTSPTTRSLLSFWNASFQVGQSTLPHPLSPLVSQTRLSGDSSTAKSKPLQDSQQPTKILLLTTTTGHSTVFSCKATVAALLTSLPTWMIHSYFLKHLPFCSVLHHFHAVSYITVKHIDQMIS